ncbi:hypothetical protein JCM11491_005282 [Sporobolomyces phaffii]
MSLAALPNELMSEIFTILHDKKSRPTPLSQQTFATLCRVSKRVLPLARSFLYYRPLPPATVTWDNALVLAESLTDHTGSHVVTLRGIVDFVSKIGQLADPRFPTRFKDANFTEAFSLYCAILKACPRVKTVELLFNTSHHLTKLLQALKVASSSTLASVRFVASAIDDRLVENALKRSGLQQIKRLDLEDVFIIGPRRIRSPSTSICLESLSLKGRAHGLNCQLHFFPTNPAALRSLHLELSTITPKEVQWILGYIPTLLERLSLVLWPAIRTLPIPPLSEYLSSSSKDRFPLAPEGIRRLAALKSLHLEGFAGPSLALLAALAASSPKLSYLDFTRSVWIPSPPATKSSTRLDPTATAIRGIFDEPAAIAALSAFDHLVDIKLGILPTTNPSAYQELEAEMTRQRVAVEWQPCRR